VINIFIQRLRDKISILKSQYQQSEMKFDILDLGIIWILFFEDWNLTVWKSYHKWEIIIETT